MQYIYLCSFGVDRFPRPDIRTHTKYSFRMPSSPSPIVADRDYRIHLRQFERSGSNNFRKLITFGINYTATERSRVRPSGPRVEKRENAYRRRIRMSLVTVDRTFDFNEQFDRVMYNTAS